MGTSTIVGSSASIRAAVERARRFAETSLPVLLVGETGTGKELFAQAVHRWSGRDGPLVDVDCGALPRDLIEGLLFGRRRGAFTGAYESSAGLVEEAHEGTLFLDELSSLSPSAQAALLRVLETGEVRRLGDRVKRRVNFRLVSAVQRGVSLRSSPARLRADLLQRVAGVVVTLPSLRERRQDVIVLAQHFARCRQRRVDPEAMTLLRQWHWPGNVRELKGVLERAVLLSCGEKIGADAVREAFATGPASLSHQTKAEEPVDGEELVAAYHAHGRSAHRAAAALGMGRATYFRRLKRAGISLRNSS